MRLIDAEDYLYCERPVGLSDELFKESHLYKSIMEQEVIKAIPLDLIKQAREQIIDEKDFAYADFERYKVECLGQDWEDVYDSAPQDDFRYGMIRCLEILNKLIAESEEK